MKRPRFVDPLAAYVAATEGDPLAEERRLYARRTRHLRDGDRPRFPWATEAHIGGAVEELDE